MCASEIEIERIMNQRIEQRETKTKLCLSIEHWGYMNCSCLESPEQCEIPTGISDIVQLKKESPYPHSLASLELLNKYGSGLTRFSKDQSHKPSHEKLCGTTGGQELSIAEIMKLASTSVIHYFSQKSDDLSKLNFPFSYAQPGLSCEDAEHVELAQLLLASAKMVSIQQFSRANKLLSMCDQLSSNTGNPVQRVVYYFTGALREKIDQKTGRNASKGLEDRERQPCDLEEPLMIEGGVPWDVDEPVMTPAVLACHQELPFMQVTQFSGIQAILENVALARKVHLVDLAIRGGFKWTVLMQALAGRHECPLELLKITVVGTASKERINDTGKRLACFAKTMNLPFSFKMVMVSDMNDLKVDFFDLEAGEVVAVCSTMRLRTILPWPDQLESLMKVIRNLHPCVMVVTEVDANINLPVFIDCFTETLFFYGALFDCLEACMDRKNPNRMTTESSYFAYGIRKNIAAKGKEKLSQHMKIDGWREFFARYGMEETELSMSSLYQANLVVKKFPCWSSCTLDMNGKCLLVGWKGMPILSLSVWKFHQERGEAFKYGF